MSLISEALRKARQEAADRGQTLPAAVVPPPVRSRLAAGLVIGAAIALAAALAGAAVVWWALGQRGSPEVAATAEADTPTQVGIERRDGAPAETHDADPAPIADSDQRPVAAGPMIAATPISSAERPVLGEPAPPTGVQESAVDGPPGQSAEERFEGVAEAGADVEQRDTADRAHEFVLEADLGDTVLSLDYIVFRPQDPFAEINGTEVHEGSVIEGFVVEEIERDRVVLRDDRGPLVLRVR